VQNCRRSIDLAQGSTLDRQYDQISQSTSIPSSNVHHVGLKTLRKDTTSQDTPLIVPPESKEPVYNPWSISNRYYTANVHFALHTASKVYGAVFEGVPAVIVAWTKGEVCTITHNLSLGSTTRPLDGDIT